MAAEFVAQLVRVVIPAGATVPTDPVSTFPISDVKRCMLLPAGSWHHTVGTGWQSGSFTSSFRDHFISAEINDDGTISVARGFAGAGAVGGAFILLEYVGPVGGPNEIILRHKETITLAAGQTTIDSASIPNVATYADLLPVSLIRTDANTNDTRHVSPTVDVINTSGTYTGRLIRSGNSGNIIACSRYYELNGSNWLVQRVLAAITAANTTQNQTLTSINALAAFVLRTFRHSQVSGGPAYASPIVWVGGSTTLSARAPAVSSTNYVAFVVSNPSMSVQLLATPDGTNDWAAGAGSAQQSQPLTFSSVDPTRSFIIGQAGSDDTTANNETSELWEFDRLSDTAGTARRGRSFGATEHVTQVIQLPQDLPNITAISSTIRTGGSVTITGTKLTGATLTMGGASLNITTNTDTQIIADCVIGSQKFGIKEFLVQTAVGAASISALVLPPSGQNYFDFYGGLNPLGVIQAIPSLVDTAQVWIRNFKDSGNVSKDASNPALIYYLPDGRSDTDATISVPSTHEVAANNGNGNGWGAFQTVTIAATAVPPVVGAIPQFNLATGVATQFDLSQYATGEETVAIVGTLPPGLSMTGTTGFITGTPTTTGVYTVTVRYNNSGGVPADSAPVTMTVIGMPTIIGAPASAVLTPVSAELTMNFANYVSGATTYTISPAVPARWDFSNGVLVVRPDLVATYGPFVVTATNDAGSVAVAPFTIQVDYYRVRIRSRNSDEQGVVTFADYFGPGGLYSITPAVPAGWGFYSTVGKLTYLSDVDGLYLFTVTDTLTGRSIQLSIEVYSGVLQTRPETTLREFLL